AFGIYGLVGATFNLWTPLVAGVVTDFASWRLLFYLSLPVVAATALIVAAAWREPETSGARRPSFDVLGLGLLLVFLVPLVVALMHATDWGWGSGSVLGLLALSGVGLVLFVRVEERARDPLIKLSLVRIPTVAGADLVYFCGQFTRIAVVLFGALYLQDDLGFSPFEAGAALLAATVGLPLTSILAGRLTDRHGPRMPMLAGLAAMLAGLVWLAIFVPTDTYVLLIPGFFVYGLSLSFFFAPPQTAIMNAVPAANRGETAGVAATTRTLGGTLAIAILGSVLVATGNFATVFWIAAGLTFAVFIAAYVLVERPSTRVSMASITDR
ncbi:MAG: MFS transporter, partial [Solirubrobacterales bacterium]